MPTGFTVIIEDRDDVTAREFILRCARAFGSSVLQRDEPLENEPRPPVPSDYYETQLAKCTADRADCLTLSDADITTRRDSDSANALAQNVKARDEYDRLTQKYADMLTAINEWTPPTPDHSELAIHA